MHVTDLESCTFTRQTAGTQSGDTALVRHFRQRVGLVHELRQLVGAEERVDDRRKCLGVDQLGRGEDLIVADIHTLADGAGHTSQAHAELVVQLLAGSTHTTVGQMVDIIDVGLLVNQFDKVFDNRRDVGLRQHAHLVGHGKVQFRVDAVASHLTEVVTLVREEELLDDAAGGLLVGRFRVAQLAIDIFDSLLRVVGGVFLQRVIDD